MRFQIVSCIIGNDRRPRSIAGVSSWASRAEAGRALDVICEEPDHPDPDDFDIVPIRAECCEDCGDIGGDTTVMRAGVVVWRRTLCEACFESRRADAERATGLLIAKKHEA